MASSTRIDELLRSAWALAVLSAYLQQPVRPMTAAEGRVLVGVGLAAPDGLGGYLAEPELEALLADPDQARILNLPGNLRQVAAAGTGAVGWDSHDDETILEQAKTSIAAAKIMVTMLISSLEGLDARLARPGAAMLDVGVGGGGFPAGLCSILPELRVVGIDVWPRALQLAARTVAEYGVADRVELREQSVADLTDTDAYDLIWLPCMFIPPEALHAGLRRLLRALRPGGWLLAGACRYTGDEKADALTAWRVERDRGTTEPADALARRLDQLGYTDVRQLGTVPGGALFAGRCPD